MSAHVSCGRLEGNISTMRKDRTFKELATIDLAGGDFEGNNMALQEKSC
jgi:hypothetical protein